MALEFEQAMPSAGAEGVPAPGITPEIALEPGKPSLINRLISLIPQRGPQSLSEVLKSDINKVAARNNTDVEYNFVPQTMPIAK